MMMKWKVQLAKAPSCYRIVGDHNGECRGCEHLGNTIQGRHTKLEAMSGSPTKRSSNSHRVPRLLSRVRPLPDCGSTFKALGADQSLPLYDRRRRSERTHKCVHAFSCRQGTV